MPPGLLPELLAGLRGLLGPARRTEHAQGSAFLAQPVVGCCQATLMAFGAQLDVDAAVGMVGLVAQKARLVVVEVAVPEGSG